MARKRTHKKQNYVGDGYGQNGVDVVMPIHGELEFMVQSVPALLKATEGLEVNFYIADTGSNRIQEEREMLAGHGIELSKSPMPGYLGGVNYMSKKCDKEFILVTTPDVIVEPNMVKIMKQTLEAYEDIGIVCPLLLFPKDSDRGPADTVQHAGMETNIKGEPHHIFISWPRNNKKVQTERECFSCTGACFMIRRELWRQVKGFDPIYGLGTWEDQDLCMKVRQAGYKIYYQSQAVGYHFVGASAIYAPEGKYEFPLTRNQQIFNNKWKSVPYTDWKVW